MFVEETIKQLDYLIVKKNFTITKIAQHCRVSRVTLYSILHGKSPEIYMTTYKKISALAYEMGYVLS